MKKVLPFVLGLAVLLAACGPKPTPTIDAASVQASAVALAFTMAAETMAAIPTATETPIPTETPTPLPPTPTFALPTLPPIQPTATTASGGACSGPIPSGWGGPAINLQIQNRTRVTVTVSLYLNETPFACGFATPVVGGKSSVSLRLPEGCYWPAAYITDPKRQTSIAGPQGCLHGSFKITLIVDYPGFTWVFP